MAQKVKKVPLEKIGRLFKVSFLGRAFGAAALAMALPLSFVFADGVNVTATVDRNQMRPGDTFTYSVNITAEGSVSFEQPRLPDLSGFELLGSWSGSQMSGSFVNGQMRTQRSQIFNYKLVATQAGTFTIGAAEVVVSGQTVRTNPIQIQVSENAAQGANPQQQDEPDPNNPMPDMEDDIFSQLLQRRMRPRSGGGGGGGGRALAPSQLDDTFFIHVETDKTKVYQGEQVTVAWYLVSRAQIADIDTLKYPSLTGFWKEDIEIATRLNFQPEVINGVPYQRALLAKYALFPIKAGTATVDTYQARCRVLYTNGLGMPQDSSITKDSDVVQIQVLPLPDTGKPASFTGAVGNFTVSSSVAAATVKANTPITLKVRIEGQGNAKVADLPALHLPATVQVYDTKSESKFFVNGRSYKEFETLLVPSTAGEVKVPPIEFSFFDPDKKVYYTQTTPELVVQVTPGDNQGVIPSDPMQSLSQAATEKKPVLPGLMLTQDKAMPMSTAQQMGVWGIVFCLTSLGLGTYAYRVLGRTEKREDMKRKIKRKIAEINVHLNSGAWRRVGVESINLISAIIGEIAGVGGAAFDFDKLVEGAPPSFKRDVAPQLKALMLKYELVGFAPEDVVGKWREKSELKKLLDETEKVLAEAAKYDFLSTERESVRS